jgi:Phage terminase large subunit gpA, ATPase domain
MFKHLEKELRKFGIGTGILYDHNVVYDHSSLPKDMADWTIKVRKIRGKDFTFNSREYLLPIYRDTSKDIFVVKPRQMEITEFSVNWLLFNLTMNPGSVGLYLTDRQDHVSAFSKMRLRSWAIDQSPILQSMIKKEGNVSWQPFANGSHLWMMSAWGDFERARSLPADFVVVDEIQSTNVEAIPVLKETLSKSPFGRFVGIGTGSDEGDHWWKLWHTGNQQEWDQNLQKWFAKNPSSTISSYHLTQYMASWLTNDIIEQKKLAYAPRRFVNEVEGWWYKSAVKPLTETDIRSLFDQSISFLRPNEVNRDIGPLYLGVDWGGGTQAFTVVWIWQLQDKNTPRFRLVYLEKIEEKSTEKQADYVARLVDAYKVDHGVMDSGGGTRQVQKLEERYGERMVKCSYMNRPEDPFEVVSRENRMVVDRTWAIETIIDLITRPETNTKMPKGVPRILIPADKLNLVEWIIDQFTCIQAESINLQSGKKYVSYTNPPGFQDDALHACVYAYMAWLMNEKSRWEYISV